VPELARTVEVAESGTINFPPVGEVSVVGKTVRAIEHDLAKRLEAGYLRSPQVTVSVKEFNSQRVTVEGAVMKPGVHALKGKMTLLQLIAMSGGIDRDVSDSTVVLFRNADGQRHATKFDIDAIRIGQAQDPLIFPGDRARVPFRSAARQSTEAANATAQITAIAPGWPRAPRHRLDLAPADIRPTCMAHPGATPSSPRSSATRNNAIPSSKGSDSETAGPISVAIANSLQAIRVRANSLGTQSLGHALRKGPPRTGRGAISAVDRHNEATAAMAAPGTPLAQEPPAQAGRGASRDPHAKAVPRH
jgi:hypothetical protein